MDLLAHCATVILVLVAAAALLVLAAYLVRRERLERETSRAAEASRLQALPPPLLGHTVVVNTPRPDDRSIRGVVTRELDGGGVVLSAAVIYNEVVGAGREAKVVEIPAGEVVVHHVAWFQILYPADPTAEA